MQRLKKVLVLLVAVTVLLIAIPVITANNTTNGIEIDWLTGDELENIVTVGNFVEGRARVRQIRGGGGGVMGYFRDGFIDESGDLVIPMIYQSASDFSEGLAAVSIRDIEWELKWGFIDRYGNEVIPFIFDYANSFSDGHATVVKDGRVGIIRNPLLDGVYSETINLEVSRNIQDDNTAIVSFYDRNRMLQTFPMEIPNAATDMKVKIWDGFGNMNPLMPVLEIN